MQNTRKKSYDNSGKRVYIVTYGCQMNEYDAELIRSILQKAGFAFTDDVLSADIILLNTCSVREKANRTVFEMIHRIRHDRRQKPAIYGILGCMATNLRETLINDPHLNIDLIAGPDSYKRLPKLIEQCITNVEEGLKPFLITKPCDIQLSNDETYEDIYPNRESSVNAWIAIMRGCDNFCSYCVVPFARGRERSRSPKSIIEETKQLVNEGFSQVTLLGQNVNSYYCDGLDFPGLLKKVCAVDGLKRLWFTSPHPKDVADELIDLIADNPKICKHIHLPLQAGSNDILNKMNRPYTHEKYLSIVDALRKKCPEIAITTDIIVGFPTETDKQFQETVDVFNDVQYDSAFIFKYSPRPQTKAAKDYTDDVPEKIKTERIVFLNELQQKFALRNNQALIGTTQEILIETLREGEAGGRTIHNKRVILKRIPEPQSARTPDQSEILGNGGAGVLGNLINVRIISATPHLLRAEAA